MLGRSASTRLSSRRIRRAPVQARGIALAYAVCKGALRACLALTQKVSASVDETIRHLEEIQWEGETEIKRAAQRLTKTYENLQRSVLAILSGVLVTALVAMLGLAWNIFKGNSSLEQLKTDL